MLVMGKSGANGGPAAGGNPRSILGSAVTIEEGKMKRAFKASSVLILAVLLITVSCRSSSDTTRSETQRQFGVRMAKMNLWREAMFRFRRAVEIEPNDAMAHNNLAVAYEANGDFDNALKEYREALRLDRTNQHIQKNYSRFVEFTQRSKKRQEKKPVTTATAPAEPATTATTTTTPPGDFR
jgi:Tfp pilus assembly protein PilF